VEEETEQEQAVQVEEMVRHRAVQTMMRHLRIACCEVDRDVPPAVQTAMRTAGDEAGGPSSDGAAHHHLTTLPIPLRIAPISRWLDEGAHAHGAGEEWPCTLEQAGRRAGRGFR